MTENIYTENGYKDRIDYFVHLSETYDCPLHNVIALAYVVGEEEDWDGLVSALQDYYGE